MSELTMPVTPETIEEVLADPKRIREVVTAAGKALNTLHYISVASAKDLDAAGFRHPEAGANAARTLLTHAFIDWKAIAKALEEAGAKLEGDDDNED